MNATFMIRPVLVLLLAGLLPGCGAIEAEPARFENMARAVAEVPISLDRPGTGAPRSADDIGLRRPQPVRIEVMEPHDLWDARDGLAPAVVQAAAPIVAEAAVQEVRRRSGELRPVSLPRPSGGQRSVQLGAYSNRARAEAAWAALKAGPAAPVLAGLQPRFEPVVVGDRNLVRLKVSAPAAAAQRLCAAARIDDPWCRRGA